MPKRLPYELLIIAALALGGCKNLPQSYTGYDAERLEIADVNARNALARISELESRISDLEARLGQ